MPRRGFVAIVGSAVLLLSCGIAATARGEEISAFYRVSYVGLPAGAVRFRFSGDGTAYRDEIAVEFQRAGTPGHAFPRHGCKRGSARGGRPRRPFALRSAL